ncbi:hypothetical protein ACSBR2_040319 [Camellia fascicularis]
MHRRSDRVTGCVMGLLFHICEHSTIVATEWPNVTPRFCRWNIGVLVEKLKWLNLSTEGCIEVNCAKLVGTIKECHVLKLAQAEDEPIQARRNVVDVDPVNTCDGRGADVGMHDMTNMEPSFNFWQPNSPNGGHVKPKIVPEFEPKSNGTPSSKEKVDRTKLVAGEV